MLVIKPVNNNIQVIRAPYLVGSSSANLDNYYSREIPNSSIKNPVFPSLNKISKVLPIKEIKIKQSKKKISKVI